MKTIYDIQQILKRFGTYIYTGNRLGDLLLMSLELDELHKMDFIHKDDFFTAKLIIKKEIAYERNKGR